MKASTKNSTSSKNTLPKNTTVIQNSQRRRFMLGTAIGASCLSLLPSAYAMRTGQPESIIVGAQDAGQWQQTVWFNRGDRHIISSNQQWPEHIVLTQHAGSFSTDQIHLQLVPAVASLLQGQVLPSNPRLHQVQQQYFLTFCCGQSSSSMQGYVAVAEQLQGPYRLQRSTPVASATELSLFNDQFGETYALITDNEMISITPFDAKTQRSGKRTALWLSSASNAKQLVCPVITASEHGAMLAALDQAGQQIVQFSSSHNNSAHINSKDINPQWQALQPLPFKSAFKSVLKHELKNSIDNSTARLTFDPSGQLWSASASSIPSNFSATRVDLTPIMSVQRA